MNSIISGNNANVGQDGTKTAFYGGANKVAVILKTGRFDFKFCTPLLTLLMMTAALYC